MRLKSLEIKGFKSFGDKVIIHFDEGVTAIVGPNGSGKSNVVDAMRWVLGEQKTRMLRSEKMENIIFNGTKNRKPSNLAEVSLSFENTKGILPTEYSTVTITRRLYRSGESEYLLNGVTCRLKDINDLFLDTGIGPDSYAIIELNMVDDILKDRNNTIKTLLEEAAGISKYKIRKRQTFNKLEETDSDLNRVNDLLFEIEKSLKQLESQAKKTDKYYRLREEYRTLSTQLALFTIRHHSGAMESLQAREQSQHSNRGDLQQKIDALEARVASLKTESSDKERHFQAVQKALNEKTLELTVFENEEKNRNERLTFLLEKQRQLQEQRTQDEGSLKDLSTKLEALQLEKVAEEEYLRTLEQNVQTLREEADRCRAAYDAAQISIRELNQQVYQLRSMINELETKQAVKDTRIQSIGEELKRYLTQQEEHSSRIAQLESELELLKPQQENADQSLRDLKQERIRLDESLNLSEAKLKELNQVLQAESRKLDARHNEYQLTKNLLEQMEGYPESIRYLKKNHDRYKQAPLLSEIVVCDEEYKVAIENLLEPYLNHFVVDTYPEAWAAVQTLNESAKGRANFFVLESLRKFSAPTIHALEGCVSALSVVEKDARYEPLFRFLLGHVQILDKDRSLQDFPEGSDQTTVVISQSGNYLRQKYTVGGGSIGLFDGKRTGKFRNLEKLAEELKQQELLIEQYREQVRQAESELTRFKQDLQDNQRALSAGENEFVKLNSQSHSLRSNLDFFGNSLEQSRQRSSKLQEEADTLQRIQEEEQNNPDLSPALLRERLEHLIEQLNVQQEQSLQLQTESAEKAQAFNQQNIVMLQQQNKIQNVVREIGYCNTQTDSIGKNMAQSALELETITEQSVVLMGNQEGKGDSYRLLTEEKVSFENAYRETEAEYNQAKQAIDQEERNLNELRRQKEQADASLQGVHEELNELKLQMHSLKERLNIEFNIDIQDLGATEPDPEFNEEESRPRAEQLRKRLADFGPINPMALEQYKEIKERYDFIIAEKTDLQNAKEALLKTISEIDETARTVFSEAFTQVRANFIRVFRSLFTEDDNCDLVLSDPNDPLECDINIIAQPKGKKPLSIHQLSGGEKTLTATALLFGIYLLKPAPFCIFDEVDAPLDDNNIDKFNNIIKTFSNESQFIIITHNKKTMAATDIMYGITMAEQGVTTVVPVDMRAFAE
ncbi:MAG: chromosome segregation protein SMC [Sphingobacteriales bacterium]|nr:chromosome segregation protein SMC [Sphingobacteriales bacterium]